MILIVGNEFDKSTFQVIDYLVNSNAEFVKINDEDILSNLKVEITNSSLKIQLLYAGKSIRSEQLSSYYYRRGGITFPFSDFENDLCDISVTDINSFRRGEINSIRQIINIIFESTQIKIGSFSKNGLDKLSQLFVAQSCGLEIPPTFVCTDKTKLIELVDSYGCLATKGIKNNFVSNFNGEQGYNMYTSTITKNELNSIPNSFFPTMFQQYIEKKYELRIFYLHGKFFSMAIFSQDNEKTKIDFRRCEKSDSIRMIPFQLPIEIEQKLGSFMTNFEMDSGSFDLIVTKDNRYVFLEVNPDGQFGMVSYPCNYFIERQIAKILCKKK